MHDIFRDVSISQQRYGQSEQTVLVLLVDAMEGISAFLEKRKPVFNQAETP